MGIESFSIPDGARLSYATFGEPSAGRTLVCHPGGPGMSAYYFGDLCGLGSDELRLVLFNPRGTGESHKPLNGSYELEDYAADVDALRAHLGLEQIALLGHSHGGFVAMVYALRYPERLARLVLLCSAPRFSDELRQEAQAAFAAHSDQSWYEDSLDAQRRRQAWEFTTSEEAAALYARELRLSFASDSPGAREFLRRVATQRPDLDALRYFNERLAASYDLRPQLADIHAPTLIVNGANDFFGPRVSARELSAIPNSRTVMLHDTGHWPFAEAPERFRAELEAFLRLDARAAQRQAPQPLA